MARVFSVIHFCDWLWLEKCRIEFNELKRMLSSIIEFGFFFEGYFHRIKLYIICLISLLTHKQKLIYSSPWKLTLKGSSNAAKVLASFILACYWNLVHPLLFHCKTPILLSSIYSIDVFHFDIVFFLAIFQISIYVENHCESLGKNWRRCVS